MVQENRRQYGYGWLVVSEQDYFDKTHQAERNPDTGLGKLAASDSSMGGRVRSATGAPVKRRLGKARSLLNPQNQDDLDLKMGLQDGKNP